MKSSSLKTSLINSVLLLALVVSDGTSLGALASPQRQPRPHEPAHEQPHRSPPPHEPAHEQPHRSPPPHEPAHEQPHRSPPPHEPAHEQLHRLPPPQPIDGNYIESDENLLSPLGEITIDHETGAKLPEEANDGELEGGDHHTGWTYNDQTGWAVEYPECVGKKLRQSPIDIITTDVIFNSRMKLEFVDYDQDVEFEYKNTHHSVSLTPIPAFSPPAIRVNWVHNGTPDEYELQEIHFHWGHGKEKGSEHEINDQKAAAEMHMVHYRKGLKKEDIGSVDNSVVVIGVFIESDAVEHNKLETLVKRAENVNGTDAEYRASSPDNLIHLLPENHHSFYTYNGSLTTPPCYEVVTWILMSEPVYMCQDQLEKLSNLEVAKPGVGRQKIQSNHRDIQPLLLRPVYASFNTTESITYSPTRIGKRIGMPHQNLGERLSDELNRFWKKVNNVKVTVKRAYGSINRARRDLLDTIRKEGGGGRAVGYDIAPAGETSGDSSAVSI